MARASTAPLGTPRRADAWPVRAVTAWASTIGCVAPPALERRLGRRYGRRGYGRKTLMLSQLVIRPASVWLVALGLLALSVATVSAARPEPDPANYAILVDCAYDADDDTSLCEFTADVANDD